MSYCEYAKDLDAEKLRQKLGVEIPQGVDTALSWFDISLSAPMLAVLLELIDDQIQEYIDLEMTDSAHFWELDYIKGQALYSQPVIAYNEPEAEAEDDDNWHTEYCCLSISDECWLFEYGKTGDSKR